MLGSLAKWLRILGYDTRFEPGLDDHQLVRISRAEGRVLLTRDRQLARRRGIELLLVSEQTLNAQLRQVVAELGLSSRGSFSRCPVCNETLLALDVESAQARVPPYVAQTQRHFSSCPTCQRVYWQGTHWQQMHQYLEQEIRRQNPGTA